MAVYQATRRDAFSKDFGLKDQIQRAAVSIASNIAEGDESGSNSQAVRFFNISKGSCAEVYTQLVIAHDIGYLDRQTFQRLSSEVSQISAMLRGLIKARSNS